MEIRLPKRSEDLRIKHFKALSNPLYDSDELTLRQVNEFVAEFTGEHINDIMVIDTKDLFKMFHHCKELYAEMKLNKPLKTITLAGVEYELINPHKVGSGWHMDWEKGDINKDPIWIACLFYYPKGVKYGTTDENKNLLYPIADRYKIFERELPLQTFLEASVFFLKKINRSMRNSTESQIATQKIVNVLQSMRGRKQSI